MKQKRFLLTALILLLAATMLGCAAKGAPLSAEESYGPSAGGYEREKVVQSGLATTADEDAYKGERNEAGLPAAEVERKIIYNVYIHLIVKDSTTAFEEITRIAKERGGSLAQSNLWRDGEQMRGTLTVRIPVDELEAALSMFRALAVDVESESMDSQDATEDYVDLTARLKNEQRTEAELVELLESRSEIGKTSDILEVHRELGQVRAQIEQIQGRMKFLENLSAQATVTITLTPDALTQPVVVGGWRPQGVARDAIRMLIRTLQFFASILIVFFLYILPILLALAIPVAVLFLIARAIWRRVRKRKGTRSE